jgi:hypothetical protein
LSFCAKAKNVGVQEQIGSKVTSIDFMFIKNLEEDKSMEQHFVKA